LIDLPPVASRVVMPLRRAAILAAAAVATLVLPLCSPATGQGNNAVARPHRVAPFVFPTGSFAFVTLRPTTTDDGFDLADITAPGTGRLTLREAFALSNKLDVETSIVLQRGALYRLTRCGPPDVSDGTANTLTHSANRTLTITGSAATIQQTCDGAGVLVQRGGDQLFNLVDLTVTGGRATRLPGGGVSRLGVGETRITNSAIMGNRVAGNAGRLSAGGAFAEGELFISASTFADNVSDHGVGGAAATGAVKAVKSSFHGNRGALASALSGGRVVVPIVSGGAPPFTGQTPDGVTLVYATLNEARGPAVTLTGGTLNAFASVIAGAAVACDLGGRATHSLGANFARGTGCGFGAGTGDVARGADPRLVVAAKMKGADVSAPARDSPLLDAPAACLPPQVKALLPVYSGGESDQLGVPRPQGAGCDIGAVEAIRAGSLVRDTVVVPVSDLPQPVRWAAGSGAQGLATSTIIVTTKHDELGGEAVSLRDAVARANLAAGETTIVLEPRAIYRLDRCVAPQVAVDNEADDLVFVGDHTLTIEGNGATIVQTCDGSGVLSIYGDGSVSLVGTTIAGGRAMIHPGGGIYLAGTGSLRLERSWITDNVSVAAGGGLAAFGPVVLLESTVSNNHSTEVGGGIIGTADVTLISSSVFDNIADLAIGAIGNHSGHLTLIFSTIAHNTFPNIAVGSMSAFGSIVSDYIAPNGMSGAGPPDVPGGPGPNLRGPPPTVPPGRFPRPSNCSVEHPSAGLGGNIATDDSCGFETVVSSFLLIPSRREAPIALVPATGMPASRMSVNLCEPHRNTTDQLGRARWTRSGCTIGAVSIPSTP